MQQHQVSDETTDSRAEELVIVEAVGHNRTLEEQWMGGAPETEVAVHKDPAQSEHCNSLDCASLYYT